MVALDLEAKTFQENGRREGLPHFGSKFKSYFQAFLLAISLCEAYLHFQGYRRSLIIIVVVIIIIMSY
jgi:hypothetical protein